MRRRLPLLALLVALLVCAGVASASGGRDAALRTVLASKAGRDFGYFPHRLGTTSCRIPFAMRSVKGICRTRVAARPGFSGQVYVNLSERWAWRDFHYSGTPRTPFLHHHWVFDLLPSGKVLLVRQVGAFPPNYAR